MKSQERIASALSSGLRSLALASGLIVPCHIAFGVPSQPAPPLQMPNMQPVGAPNMFLPNGQMNPNQNSNLPSAFNWHPYTPGTAVSTTPAKPVPPSSYIIPPMYSGSGGYRLYSPPAGWNSPAIIAPTPSAGDRDGRRGPQQTYGDSTVTIIENGPSTSSGDYSYNGYCDQSTGPGVYPSVYSDYAGVPGYIYNPSDVSVSQNPYYPQYSTSYLPFTTPVYQITNNQYNYYGNAQPETTAPQGSASVSNQDAPPAADDDSYQAAFADIEQAWLTGNVELIRKHLHDDNTKIDVLIDRKYAYSITSTDYVQITRDAMKTLSTVSFKFTRLRKAKNGDITAYGVHVYAPAAGDSDAVDDTVPFDTQNSSTDAAPAKDAKASTSSTDSPSDTGAKKTMFVSYTLRNTDGAWNIVLVDSSKKKLVPSQSTDQAGQL